MDKDEAIRAVLDDIEEIMGAGPYYEGEPKEQLDELRQQLASLEPVIKAGMGL